MPILCTTPDTQRLRLSCQNLQHQHPLNLLGMGNLTLPPDVWIQDYRVGPGICFNKLFR
ncbi:unnamed protein product [Nyctereutes procyonoides]|uniref:(raccoon dog) hypothetical protein n=1 Tax=Nyctereutes procyonoides TaxID=34880 RepID=A0A811YC04_NYCPR|nr:unnamed protein product [Nyctereutes procyonoides]